LLASSILLFYLGAAFAYAVVFPLVFAFLTGVAPEGVAVMTDITHYLDFVLTLFFAFGIAFEVPIATIVLVMAGVTTPEKLSAKRPYVIVGAFIIGMFLTPPDIISQTLLALPMWVLFEVGLLFARMVSRERARRARDADEVDDDMAPAAVAATASGAAAATTAVDADAVDDGEFRPLDEQEMEDEFDRIEREFDAMENADVADSDDTADDDVEDSDDTADSTTEDAPEPWTEDDSADMLDEEDFPERTATEALVDAKLEQIAAYRAIESYDEARRLLYEVLSEGNEEQVRVARNILEQLDS
jgi:sec-independent protein translocase protein TatC